MKNPKYTHIYSSTDKLVSISLDSDLTSERPPTPVITLHTNNHSRTRKLPSGLFEYMPTKEEIHAIAEAIQKSDPSVTYIFERSMHNKPEGRKQYWIEQNRRRTAR